MRRVRPLEAGAAQVLSRGYARSPTFRALVDALEASNVIVHVEQLEPRPGRVAGAMRFIASTPDYRYLRISLYARLPPDDSVALLGHELQHAVEVARTGWVVDSQSCAALYQAIGHPSCNTPGACFDTAEAVQAGRQVARELQRQGD